MSEPTHRTIEANGIRIHLAEQAHRTSEVLVVPRLCPECVVLMARHSIVGACRGRVPCRRSRHARLWTDGPSRGNRTVYAVSSGRRHGRHLGRARRKNRRDRRTRLGRPGGLAFGASTSGPVPGGGGTRACPISSARRGRADHSDAAECRCQLLSTVFSATRRRGGGTRGRYPRLDSQEFCIPDPGDVPRGANPSGGSGGGNGGVGMVPRTGGWLSRACPTRKRCCRRGSAPRIWIFMRSSSGNRVFAAVSIGTAISTATGSCWRRTLAPPSRCRRFTWRVTWTWLSPSPRMKEVVSPTWRATFCAASRHRHAARLRALDPAGARQ